MKVTVTAPPPPGVSVEPEVVKVVTIQVGVQGPPGVPGPAGADGADGAPGADGREVELQTSATHIQWRYLGESAWTDLVLLSDLEGPQGPAGSDGADGREVELQVTGTHIQWRLTGGSWQNLIALSELEGPQGPKGAPGEAGAPGVGVPAGGAIGQVLAKASNTDYDTEWVTGGGGGGVDWGDIGGALDDQADLAAALAAKLDRLAVVNSYAGNRALDAADSGAYVRVTSAGTVTLPDGLPVGFQCVIVNATDAATVALTAATTLTIPAGFEPEIQNRRAVTVIHVGSDVWEAHGALVEEAA